MRIGFACIVLDPATLKPYEDMRFRTATAAHLAKFGPKERRAYLQPVVRDNVRALYNVVGYLIGKEPGARMFRITSSLFPLYTHPIAKTVYADRGFMGEVERALGHVGEYARAHGVRLSQHPGQYVVLNSLNPKTVTNSIRELEYHTHVARLMGYTEGWHRDGYVMNIHGGARAGGIDRFLKNSLRLSQEARSILTVENDENSFGPHDFEPLLDHYPVVLDPFHYLVQTGRHIRHESAFLNRVLAGWRGTRPKMHVSAWPALPVIGEAVDELRMREHPLVERSTVVAAGLNRVTMRAHSNGIWATGVANYFLGFSDRWDLMVECKAKNLAATALRNHAAQWLIQEKKHERQRTG